jgi:hypothetical protein
MPLWSLERSTETRQSATELQRADVCAMAQFGPQAQKASDVANLMGRASTNLGPARAELINMGLLYTPQHAYASFAVPHFDRSSRVRARRRQSQGSGLGDAPATTSEIPGSASRTPLRACSGTQKGLVRRSGSMFPQP